MVTQASTDASIWRCTEKLGKPRGPKTKKNWCRPGRRGGRGGGRGGGFRGPFVIVNVIGTIIDALEYAEEQEYCEANPCECGPLDECVG
jgi:hypothetical protein